MGLMNMFDKLDDIVYLPVKAVTNWLEEPLRRKEHERELEKSKQPFELEMWRAREQEKLRQEAEKADLELWNMEQDAQLARNTAIVEAIKQYQIDLGKAQETMIANIGYMNLDLRGKALNMVSSYTKLYVDQQEEAKQKAKNDLAEIQTLYADNDRLREKMEDVIIDQMRAIIDSSRTFINGLSKDLEKINALTDKLTEEATENVADIIKTVAGTKSFLTSGTQTSSENLIGGRDERPRLTSGK